MKAPHMDALRRGVEKGGEYTFSDTRTYTYKPEN